MLRGVWAELVRRYRSRHILGSDKGAFELGGDCGSSDACALLSFGFDRILRLNVKLANQFANRGALHLATGHKSDLEFFMLYFLNGQEIHTCDREWDFQGLLFPMGDKSSLTRRRHRRTLHCLILSRRSHPQ